MMATIDQDSLNDKEAEAPGAAMIFRQFLPEHAGATYFRDVHTHNGDWDEQILFLHRILSS